MKSAFYIVLIIRSQIIFGKKRDKTLDSRRLNVFWSN